MESPSDVRVEIERRLTEDGLNPQCPDEEKLFFVWRLYRHAESDLHKAIENEEHLKRSQTEEMQEVENYVEHIRHLSDEREALIQELETENDALKGEIEHLRQEENAAALRDETAEMLVQQGLEEIAHATTSEQIAFLLVERARLLDELEAEQTRSMSADGRASEELQRTLDRERNEFEDELVQQRDGIKLIKEKLKQEHEEEINALLDENNKFEEDLSDAKRKVAELENEVSSLRQELDKQKEVVEKEKESRESDSRASTPRHRPASPARSPSDVTIRRIIEEKTKIEGEALQLKTRLRNLESENSELQEKVRKMEADLTKSQTSQQQLMMKNKSLRAELEETEQQLEDTETSLDEVTSERDELKETVEKLTTELSGLKNENQKSGSFQDIIEILTNEKKQLAIQLETTKKELDNTIAEKDDLANQKLELSKGEIQLTNEIQTLKTELSDIKFAKDKYTEQEDELCKTQTLLNSTEEELESLKFDKDNLSKHTELLSKENKDLLNKLEAAQIEIENTRLDSQDLAKQEMIVSHLREQNQKLTKELSDMKTKEGDLSQKEEGLLKEKEDLEQRFKQEIENLKAKLQLVLTELTKSKGVIEQERSENSELQQRIIELENMVDDVSQASVVDSKISNLSELEIRVKELEQSVAEKHILEDELETERKRTCALRKQIDELALKSEDELDDQDLENELQEEKNQNAILKSQMEQMVLELQESANNQSLQTELEKEKQQNSVLKSKLEKLEHSLKSDNRKEDLEKELAAEKQQNLNLKNKLEELVVRIQDDSSRRALEKELSQEKQQTAILRSKLTQLSRPSPDDTDGRDIRRELAAEREQTAALRCQLEEMEAIQEELEVWQDEVERERQSKSQLELRLQEMEQATEDNTQKQEAIQVSLSNKIKSLESRVQALQDDLFAAQDELQVVQENHEKAMKESQVDLQARLDAEIRKQQELQYETSKQLAQAQIKQEEGTSVSQRLEAQKVQNLEKQIEAMKSRLNESQKELEMIFSERDSLLSEVKLLQESAKQHSDTESTEQDSIRRELESTKRELEHLKLSAKYEGEERQNHTDRIRTLEDLSKQLELDNRELAKKLSETLVQFQQTEELLKKEKHRNADKQQHNNRQLSQMKTDLDAANQQIRQSREEMQKKQTYIMKLEADHVGLSAKYESTIARLETELNELKQYHRKELDNLTTKVEVANKESKELRNLLREKEQDFLNKQHEAGRTKTSCERLEAQLQTEIKIRTDLENRNTALDQEINKVWTQVRSLMEKNASLENAKRNLEDELERKNSSSRDTETTYANMSANTESALKAAQNRAENGEQRAEKLQRELQDMSLKLQTVEHQLYQAENSKLDLQTKKDQLTEMKTKLEGEKVQRAMLDQTVNEMKHQVSLLRQREGKVLDQNRELQHTLLDLESKLEEMHDRSQTAFEMQQRISEFGKKNMMDQILKCQKDMKELQYELLSANERREIQEKKYEERKYKTKGKLLKAREFYSKERGRMQDQVRRMDDDLRLTRAMLRKEVDWKEKMDQNHKDLLHEKRELLSQVTEKDEVLREKTRMVSSLQVRSKYLEEENSRLQDRIDTIIQQKQGLDKTLKDYKARMGRELPLTGDRNLQSFTAGTSGLGNSVDSSWDQDNLVDALLTFRTPSSNPAINSYLNRTYPGGTVDLYTGDGYSEDSSYIQEYDA